MVKKEEEFLRLTPSQTANSQPTESAEDRERRQYAAAILDSPELLLQYSQQRGEVHILLLLRIGAMPPPRVFFLANTRLKPPADHDRHASTLHLTAVWHESAAAGATTGTRFVGISVRRRPIIFHRW